MAKASKIEILSSVDIAATAVKAAEQAYQFGAGSYTHEAMLQSRKAYTSILLETELFQSVEWGCPVKF